MPEAASHPNQVERLNTLYSYEILDTDKEQEFDEVVQLAAGICDTEISVINLIDAERQWFKSEVGLGVRETPLATSICSHVILEDDFVEINDTLKDPRMMDNPLCCGDPGLRFYAGALLKADNGLPIGTLCVLDRQPRRLNAMQRDALRVLAAQVMARLDLKRALRTHEILRQEVDHRVKNSLQSLSAYSNIQARESRSPEAVQAFELMQQRIEIAAILHELLYKTDAGANVDLASYINEIAGFLRGISPPNVTIQTDLESVCVGSAQASSVGLILNEFAANSFRHAFPDERVGVIRFVLRPQEGDRVSLLCADDGVGISANGNRVSTGLGIKVMEAACSNLGCSYVFSDGKKGVVAQIEFQR